MSPPIDTQYYWQTGPASSFEWFTNKICSFTDLFNHFKDNMLAANGGADKNECVGFVSPTYLLIVSNTQEFTLLMMRNVIKLWNSIERIAGETGVWDTLILSVILQESSGNCRVVVCFSLWHAILIRLTRF